MHCVAIGYPEHLPSITAWDAKCTPHELLLSIHVQHAVVHTQRTLGQLRIPSTMTTEVEIDCRSIGQNAVKLFFL